MVQILLNNFGASTSGIGALGFSPSAFIIQLITFILVFLVLRKWAFKPILKILNERRETIEKGVNLGQQMAKEKLELEDKVDKALRAARAKADEVLSSAQQSARQVIAEAEENAKVKAEQLMVDAESRIKQETSAAWKDLQKDLAVLISETTEAIIDEKVDSKKDNELIDKALASRRAT